MIFGSSVNAEDCNHATPRHYAAQRMFNSQRDKSEDFLYALHSVGAARCSRGSLECTEGCSFEGKYDGEKPEGKLQ